MAVEPVAPSQFTVSTTPGRRGQQRMITITMVGMSARKRKRIKKFVDNQKGVVKNAHRSKDVITAPIADGVPAHVAEQSIHDLLTTQIAAMDAQRDEPKAFIKGPGHINRALAMTAATR